MIGRDAQIHLLEAVLEEMKRAKGKIATLALGYGGGVSALEAMDGKRLGLSESEEKDIVLRWRQSNTRIVQLWKTLEKAAVRAVQGFGPVTVHRGITFEKRWGMLLITLPSSRTICYPRVRIEEEDGKESIVYEGMNQVTKKWEEIRTYGGKLTENIVQATARDILGEVLLRAEDAGLDVVFHIHDEIVVACSASPSAGPRDCRSRERDIRLIFILKTDFLLWEIMR